MRFYKIQLFGTLFVLLRFTFVASAETTTVRITPAMRSDLDVYKAETRSGRHYTCFKPENGESIFGTIGSGYFKETTHYSSKHIAKIAQSCLADSSSTQSTAVNTADIPLNAVAASGSSAPAEGASVTISTPGDFNKDNCVDDLDYLVWRKTQNQTVTPGSGADASGNGIVDAADYNLWRANFGTCPATPPPIPNLDLWKSQMLSYGTVHCNNYLNGAINFDTHLLATYYDAEWVFYQIGDFTKDSKWYNCAQAAENVYRDQYLIPNNAVLPGYWNFSHGVTRDFLSTGDLTSKNAALMLAQNASYAPDTTPLSWTVDSTMSREVAYAIMAYLNAESIGGPVRARRNQLVEQAFSHIDQWFISRTAPYVRPFMFSLTAHALISYDSQVGGMTDRTVTALSQGADWIWNNMWLPGNEAFKYTDRVTDTGGTEAAPDLNLLIAPIYAWLYHQTGNVTYRDRGDQIFVGGTKSAYLTNAKQFNQNYRWSFDFIKWRSAKPLK
jgi:hypothetical protein